MSGPVIVVGVGNLYRSDDGIGLVILRELQVNGPSDVMYIENNGDGAALLEILSQDSRVILIDAAVSDAPAGTVLRLNALAQPLPADFSFASTHTFGIAEAIRLAQALHQLPNRLILYAVVGKHFATDETLSAEVVHAIRQVVPLVIQEIQVLSSPIS